MNIDLACQIGSVAPDMASETFGAVLDRLSSLGYRRVVFPPLDPETTDVAMVRDELLRHNLSPITIVEQALAANVSSDDDAVRAAGEEALRAGVDLTLAIGGDQMNGVPYSLFGHPTAPVSETTFARTAVAVGRVADYAHLRGVTMTFEVLNRYETSTINTAARAMDFVELSGSDHLQIHLDTFHMAVEEADMSAAIRLALPRLAYLELGQSGRGLLSTGAVDLPGVVAKALDEGYEGRWGVEAFSRSLLPDPVADTLAIWRSPYEDGIAFAEDAVRVVRHGWNKATGHR